jgi:hypothetical protein
MIAVFMKTTNYDTLSYQLIGERVVSGRSIYPDLAYYHHPYLPFLLYFEAIDVYLSRWGLPFTLVLKVLFSCFDLVATYFIYKLSNAKNALIYAVNPSMIFLSAAHGQIEAIPFACILGSIYYAQYHRTTLSAMFLSCAVLVKTWPAFLMGVFLRKAKQYYLYPIALGIPCLFVLLYARIFHESIIEILRPVASYRGIYGYYGLGIFLSYIFPQAQGMQLASIKIISSISIILLFLYSLCIKWNDVITGCFRYLLLICLLVISGANPLWLLPFVILVRPQLWKVWIIVIGVQSAIEIPLIHLQAQQHIYNDVLRQLSLILGMWLYVLEAKMFFYRKNK